MIKEVDKVNPKKKPCIIHTTRPIDDGDLVADIVTSIADKDDRGLQALDYQVSTSNVGNQTKNQQMNLTDIMATTNKSRIIKDK